MNETSHNADELNVDFENFSVPRERSEALRSTIQRVKDANIVETFKNLVQELGVEEVSSQDDQVATLIKSKNARVFRYVLDAESDNKKVFEVFQFEQELKAMMASKPVFEISFLPKDKDFILFYIDPNFLETWPELFKQIVEISKEAEKIKSDRQRHFKKFAKKVVVSDLDTPSEDFVAQPLDHGDSV